MKRYCPICHDEVVDGLKGAFAPFCSERCQLVDLHGWLTEKYAMPAQEDDPEIFEE
ncbi:MAG: DNA gyrase inhibitor YacG [Phycisphaerae bacterium]|nr:DNA gyrase inhibitor YacG [Phycisphaerae bacterium]